MTDAAAFLRDLEAKPDALRALGGILRAGDPWAAVTDVRRVVALGLGSSRFAALPVTARLRAAGIDAVTEYAGVLGHPGGPGTLAVGSRRRDAPPRPSPRCGAIAMPAA